MQIDKLSGSFILTADIGGTHITSAIYDGERDSVIEDTISRVGFSSKGSAQDILNSWAEALSQTLRKTEVAISGVGIAMPGPFDYETGVSYITGLSKYESIYRMNIKQQLAKMLQLPAEIFKFRNDAEAAIAGEVAAGAGKGADSIIGITLGTGFGSAWSVDGITKDLNLGSEPYKDSIADDHLSTRWFLKRYYELSGISITEVSELALIAKESPMAKVVFSEFAANMGNFLLEPVLHFRPETLVVCGNIAKASEFFLPVVSRQLNMTSLKIGQLGEYAALIGVADLFRTNSNPQRISL
ncbi:MAG: nagK [Mucilaginibacter sp.]|nr:nagK [Mucilaginibacter sp.]